MTFFEFVFVELEIATQQAIEHIALTETRNNTNRWNSFDNNERTKKL
jgi:hypothetical protein